MDDKAAIRKQVIEEIAHAVGVWGRTIQLEKRFEKVTTNDVEVFIRSLSSVHCTKTGESK